jgi:phage terminase large subunit
VDWPPNYTAELRRRADLELGVARNPALLEGALARYAESVTAFASDCAWLHEPRNANVGEPVLVPVVLFPRQAEFLEWLAERYRTRTSAPVEKSRDSGATWMACVFSVWLWLFHPGSIVGFGSRKEMLVDRQGDMQSIFEKVRTIVRRLPRYLLPAGFKPEVHSNYMRIINPAIDTSIIGEAGDQIGRGGRTSVYFVDEAAYLERPQLIEASLTATTDCRIDISSPLVGTLFHEWCATALNKFVFDVSDAPWHTPEWAARKKAELEAKGLGQIYRREYLRDATAGLSGQLIDSEWIEAAVGAAERMKLDLLQPGGKRIAALDVADGGSDANALAVRHGPRVTFLEKRHDLRADEAGAWAYAVGLEHKCDELRYDAIGVGAGAGAALRGKPGIKEITAWSGADRVVDGRHPWDGGDGRTNADMFVNANAQAWWHLRQRFIETYKAATGVAHDSEMVIALDPELPELRQLKSELAQVLYGHNPNGKIQIVKTPAGYRSPNLADAVKMAFAPTPAGITIIAIF